MKYSKFIANLLSAALIGSALVGCGSNESVSEVKSEIESVEASSESTSISEIDSTTSASIVEESSPVVEYEHDNYFNYVLLDDDTYKIVECTVKTGKGNFVDIPATFNGKNVTVIGASAFEENSCVSQLTIAEGITTIEDRAFYRLRSVRQLYIPKTVTSIGQDAFTQMGYGTQGGTATQIYVIFNSKTPDGITQNHMFGTDYSTSANQLRIYCETKAMAKLFKDAWTEYADFVTTEASLN